MERRSAQELRPGAAQVSLDDAAALEEDAGRRGPTLPFHQAAVHALRHLREAGEVVAAEVVGLARLDAIHRVPVDLHEGVDVIAERHHAGHEAEPHALLDRPLVPFPDRLPQLTVVQGQVHRDRLAARGEEALGKERRDPVSQQGVHAEERGAHPHLAEGLAETPHRLPGEPGRAPRRLAQQEPRIPIGRDHVGRRLAVHRLRPERVAAAQEVGDEQLRVAGSGQERPRPGPVPVRVQPHVLRTVVEVVGQPGQGLGPARIAELEMRDVH